MAIYFLLMAFVLGASPLKKQSKKMYLIICLFFIWIIMAFRSYFVGNDTIAYVNMFPLLASLPLSLYGSNLFSILFTKNRFEYGYVVFDKLVYSLSHNPRWLLIISSFIIVFFLGYILCKYSNDLTLALIIFITMGFMSGSMSQIRQYIAWAVCLYSIRYIVNNNLFKFILTIIIAMLFHISAIIFLPLYWLAKIKLNLKKGILFFVITLPLFIFFDSISNTVGLFINSYNDYAEQLANNGTTGYLSITTNLIIFSLLFVLILYLSHINKWKNLGEKKLKLHNLSLWMLVCAFAVFVLSYKFSQLDRLSTYFTCSIMFLLPNELENEEQSATKQILKIIVIVFMIANFVIVNILRPEWNGIVPYHFLSMWWG